MTVSDQKKEYDLIFSLGEACSCTAILRTAGLQLFSYPFDWLYGSSFVGRCKILATRFVRYIDKEDLEFSELDYVVNYKCLKPIFRRYELKISLPLSYHLKKLALKMLVRLIPLRGKRRKLKRKWHL